MNIQIAKVNAVAIYILFIIITVVAANVDTGETKILTIEETNKIIGYRYRGGRILKPSRSKAITTENKELKEDKSKLEYIGTFDMSHYCLEIRSDIPGHANICGYSNVGCRGDILTPGTSLAVPLQLINSCLPVGSKVKVVYSDGKEEYLTVQDTGGALGKLNRIDKAVQNHEQALQLGVARGVKLYKIN